MSAQRQGVRGFGLGPLENRKNFGFFFIVCSLFVFIAKMTIFRNLWVVAHPAEFSLAGFEFLMRQGSRALKGSNFSGFGAGGFEFFARQGSHAPWGIRL